jgi:hypothetical protein
MVEKGTECESERKMERQARRRSELTGGKERIIAVVKVGTEGKGGGGEGRERKCSGDNVREAEGNAERAEQGEGR